MVGWVDNYVLLLFNVQLNVQLIGFGVRNDLLPLLGDDVCLADVVYIASVARRSQTLRHSSQQLLLVLLRVRLLL